MQASLYSFSVRFRIQVYSAQLHLQPSFQWRPYLYDDGIPKSVRRSRADRKVELACISRPDPVLFSGVPRFRKVSRTFSGPCSWVLGLRLRERYALTGCLFSYGSSLVIQSIDFPFLRSSMNARGGTGFTPCL